MNRFLNIMSNALETETFISCTWSNPRKSDNFKKITAKPILLNEQPMVQFAKLKDNKEHHDNIALSDVSNYITEQCTGFKQAQCFTSNADYQILINKKQETNIKKKAPTKKAPNSLSHNRQKKYILDTPSSTSFLKELGLMDQNGHIKPSKYDKYKQINRYLEIVSDSLQTLDQPFLRIIDFGCGKSYLTFALYHYLTVLLNKQVEVIGLDLKTDVIAFCNKLSEQLGYTGLKFQVGDIGKYTTDQQIDMVVSLHACNTATDAALEKAIGWGAKVILSVPCCHHEAYTQIKNDALQPILKHGILKERIAALVTDGLRAQLLETVGYKVNVIEFIDMAHTPKNILIRAILKNNATNSSKDYAAYRRACESLNLDLTLHKLLGLSENAL